MEPDLKNYFDSLYQRFEPVLICVCPQVPTENLYQTLVETASFLVYGPNGDFVKAQINNPVGLSASLLLYIAGIHRHIERRQRREFTTAFNYYRLKKAIVIKCGNDLVPLFVYLSHLLQYGKKIFLDKPVTDHHLEIWDLIEGPSMAPPKGKEMQPLR